MVDDPLPLGRAHILASTAIREARRAGIAVETLIAVGDVRRFEPAVHSVDVLGIAPATEHRAVMHAFTRLPLALGSRQVSDRGVTINTDRGVLTLHLTTPDQAGAALVWLTGSTSHVAALSERAAVRGLRLEAAELADADGQPVRCPSEDDLYDRLDLPFVPPELRAGAGELESAERNALPALVLERHIRGDLHTHTSWSDGRDPAETMVLAARQLGYEYLAITDHSQRAWSSRKLAVDDIPRQRDEIEALRRTITGIEILHGIEVDIMGDGTLDFDDQVLEGFDIVLASLHDACDQEGPQLTERYLKAIHHPFVNVITHPANRSPARFEGFDVDFDALFAAAEWLARQSPSTATAIARSGWRARCGSASARRGAAGSSRGTC